MVVWLLLISVMIAAISGCPGLFISRRSMLGQWIATGLNLIASALGLAALVLHTCVPQMSAQLTGNGPASWTFAVAIDDISLFSSSRFF